MSNGDGYVLNVDFARFRLDGSDKKRVGKRFKKGDVLKGVALGNPDGLVAEGILVKKNTDEAEKATPTTAATTAPVKK